MKGGRAQDKMSSTKSNRSRKSSSISRKLLAAGFCLALLPYADAHTYHRNRAAWKPNWDPNRPVRKGPPLKRDGGKPLVLVPIGKEEFGDEPIVVSQLEGMGASNANGNDGSGAACTTGDCGGRLDCAITGETPVTLAEFDLAGNGGSQTFYDISLVDGYNIPLGLVYIPGDNPDLQAIPPNLVNAACIASTGYLAAIASTGTNGNSSNATYPIPLEDTVDNTAAMSWCPWDLQKTPPNKPGDGVYPYPDDNIQRPTFDPCLSACAKTNAASDCCTGSYDEPSKCPSQ
ncbi:hypothetical protein DID88_005695 [Monilinia fructigena]|uniref:Uncharacterized protein n=1 Tax=Monilinia fructigena TaxID=38457 RepID=A0A395J1R4_9HELO|nr:hypothetical protein DID88_005695 [Monilinia fructigena]